MMVGLPVTFGIWAAASIIRLQLLLVHLAWLQLLHRAPGPDERRLQFNVWEFGGGLNNSVSVVACAPGRLLARVRPFSK